jgi:hypothetical protein
MIPEVANLKTEQEVKSAIKKTQFSALSKEKKRQLMGQLFKRLYQINNL